MSVIDRALQGLTTTPAQAPALSPHEALAAILVASVSVDGSVGVGESAQVQGLLATSRLFQAGGQRLSERAIERAVALLDERGVDDALKAAAEALPQELRATAFAVAVDLVLCDGRVEAREKAYIDSLQALLGIDDALAVRIVEVLLIKNRA